MNMKPALLLVLALALALPALTPPASAQSFGAPGFVDYQGTVYDGSQKPLGRGSETSPFLPATPTNYTMQFRIYDAQSAGNLIYAETQTVTVSLGQFSVRLGSGAPITPAPAPAPTQSTITGAFTLETLNPKERYLEVTVIIPPAVVGTAITPRLAFQTSPFSFAAERAKSADSVAQASGNSTLGVTTAASLTVAGTTRINASNYLEFGAGVSGKQSDAGKVGYKLFSTDALDIVGAGTTGSDRKLKIYAEGGTTFTGPISGTSATFSGSVTAPSGSFTTAGATNLTASTANFNRLGLYRTSNSYTLLNMQVKPGDDWLIYAFNEAGAGVFSVYKDGTISSSSNINATSNISATGNVNAGGILNATGSVYSGGSLRATSGNAQLLINGADYSGVTAQIKSRAGDGTILILGVPADPEYFTFYADGSASKLVAGGWSGYSDIKLKENIENLSGALDKVLKLRSVTFDFKDPKYGRGRQTGFIAQEIEKVFPNWVSESKDGTKLVTFMGFESLTVQALRELRAEKDQQLADRDAQIVELKKRLAELTSAEQKREDRLARLESMLLPPTVAGEGGIVPAPAVAPLPKDEPYPRPPVPVVFQLPDEARNTDTPKRTPKTFK